MQGWCNLCITKPLYSHFLPNSFSMAWNRKTAWSEAVTTAGELCIFEWLLFLKQTQYVMKHIQQYFLQFSNLFLWSYLFHKPQSWICNILCCSQEIKWLNIVWYQKCFSLQKTLLMRNFNKCNLHKCMNIIW